MQGVRLFCALCLSLAMISGATAETSYYGNGGDILDVGLGCGSSLSVPTIFQTIHIADSPDASNVSVDLIGLKHSFIGDLEISLTGPGGYATHLIDRPGGSSDACGSSSDFIYTNSYGWDNAFPAFPENPVTPLPSGFWHPTGDLGILSTPLPTGNVNGDWTLIIRDWKDRDFGALDQWRIRVNEVPEPATLALLAGGALIFARRRRG